MSTSRTCCREEVRLDMGAILDYLQDRVVLVTGGGGSIGSGAVPADRAV